MRVNHRIVPNGPGASQSRERDIIDDRLGGIVTSIRGGSDLGAY